MQGDLHSLSSAILTRDKMSRLLRPSCVEDNDNLCREHCWSPSTTYSEAALIMWQEFPCIFMHCRAL